MKSLPITDLKTALIRIKDLEMREQIAADAYHAMKARAERAESMLAGSPDAPKAKDPIAEIAAMHRDAYAGRTHDDNMELLCN